MSVCYSSECVGQLEVLDPTLWWPYTMSDNPGYLYTLEVRAALPAAAGEEDVYKMSVGIRHVSWDEDNFKINHRVT